MFDVSMWLRLNKTLFAVICSIEIKTKPLVKKISSDFQKKKKRFGITYHIVKYRRGELSKSANGRAFDPRIDKHQRH